MSLPLIRRSKSKHRAADKVTELKQKLKHQEAETVSAFGQLIGAADRIAILEHDLADARTRRAEAEQVVRCLAADLDERTGERDQAQAEVDRLQALLAPYLAAEANANAVTIPAAFRDAAAFEDQATAPIDVRGLRNRFAAGPVVSLHHSPQAADPAHIPAPAA
ncbi:hypothetical protein [Streptomyces sp. NPDC007346]|uniref:hypothetical protein n=1 Tax=Streptomyces sp. NPDC007346 TaxID=3154682 RepID=UPI003456DB8F